jgi:hypothetical protein
MTFDVYTSAVYYNTSGVFNYYRWGDGQLFNPSSIATPFIINTAVDKCLVLRNVYNLASENCNSEKYFVCEN